MQLGIKDKVALVTGASRSLGKSMAECLASEGARLVLVARGQKELEELAKALPKVTAPHLFYCSDLSKENAPSELCAFLEREKIIPDIVVHNLGGTLGVTDPLCSVEEWKKVFRLNLEIPIELNQRLLPYLQERKWGRICMVSSISALENQGPPSYCAAKAALVAYTRSVGRYVAKDGVIMNTILPGPIFAEKNYWENISKEHPEYVKKYVKERIAIGRLGTPEEIGKVVTFMCSQNASFCVGSTIVVDGGQGLSFYADHQ